MDECKELLQKMVDELEKSRIELEKINKKLASVLGGD